LLSEPSELIERDWEAAFFATSAVLGEAVEVSLASAGEPTTAEGVDLVRALRSTSRERRAHAIARVVSELARELEAVGLA
jgi:hypothetical protein